MDFKAQKPIYRQIADFILEQVISDELTAEGRLQSVRELAAEVQVNPNTIVRTYSFLSEEGIIYNQRGVGYFIAADARAKAYALQRKAFIEEELPALFQTMELLQIDFEELQQLHQQLHQHENK